jgi:AcrR family transcriptional regulator
MPKTSAAAKEARQEQILNAAVRCFARKGYYATTVEDLVAETGLSRGALYLYFPNKEVLYLALSDRWTCGLEEAVQRQVTPHMSPGDILQLVIEVTGDHVEADGAACRVLMEGWTLGHVLPALGEQVRRQQAQARRVFAQLLEAGIAGGELRGDLDGALHAQLLLAMVQGLMVEWHLSPGSIDWHMVALETLLGLRAATLLWLQRNAGPRKSQWRDEDEAVIMQKAQLAERCSDRTFQRYSSRPSDAGLTVRSGSRYSPR